MRRVPNRKYHRDDQQSAVRLHHAARAAEIGQALDPAPIVDDMGKAIKHRQRRGRSQRSRQLRTDAIRQSSRLKLMPKRLKQHVAG